MNLDRSGRFLGRILYWQSKDRMSEEDLRTLQEVMFRNGIYADAEFDNKKYYLRIRNHKDDEKKTNFFIHIFLFVLTIFTTAITGSMLRGRNPFESFDNFSLGLPYSFALLTILFFHEMGHYLSARRHRVNVTLPYFIPFFLPVFHPGTLGAFIKIKSSIPDKKALFDIGITGPLAGFIVSIIFITIGFARLPDEAGVFAYLTDIHPVQDHESLNLTLGSTLLFSFLSDLFNGQRVPMNELYHFPFLFAGWLGLLVTAINLMPIGQLDGGHITYALFGRPAKALAILAFLLLIGLNVYLITQFDSYVWVLWSLLILVLIRFRHPPTRNDSLDIGRGRRILGWLSYLIFIVSFSPMPLYIP